MDLIRQEVDRILNKMREDVSKLELQIAELKKKANMELIPLQERCTHDRIKMIMVGGICVDCKKTLHASRDFSFRYYDYDKEKKLFIRKEEI